MPHTTEQDLRSLPAGRAEQAADASPVRVIDDADPRDWNDYVLARPSHLFHRAEWEQVFSFYRLPFRRLLAVRGQGAGAKGQGAGCGCQVSGEEDGSGRGAGIRGQVSGVGCQGAEEEELGGQEQGQQFTRPPDETMVGVLPLVWQRSFLFGNQFVSLPVFDTAGVLADDAEARDALVKRAVEIAADAGAAVVLLRQAEPLALSPHVRTDKVLLRMKLPSDPDTLWKAFDPKVRNQARKGPKSGLKVKQGKAELLSDFYEVYSTNMRDLGSPPHHPRFFHAVFEAFERETQIYVVTLDEQPVGAGFTMANGDRLEIPWASSLRVHNRLCVNHAMYWRILQDACEDGFRWFCFGRSTPGTGPFNFKMQWGPEAVQLHWYYIAPRGDVAPHILAPQQSYGWATGIWKRLPLPVVRWLGPKLVAKIP